MTFLIIISKTTWFSSLVVKMTRFDQFCVCVSLGSLFVLHLSGKTMDSSVLISQQSTQDFRMLLQDVRLQALHRADGLPEEEKSTGKPGFQKTVDASR